MKCITLNLRFDNKGDGINKWGNRKELVMQFIKNEDPDVICFQEVLNSQMNDLDGALDVYSHVGVGRLDGKSKGEYVPIFYKKIKYDKVGDGNFWLSEQPDSVGSIGWDAKLPRIVTWVILREKKTCKEFLVINTHFDHIGRKARTQSAELIKRWISENANHTSVILAGDLNVAENSEPYILLTDDRSPLMETYMDNLKQEGSNYTFHGFGRVPETERLKIDYVFVSRDIKVKSLCIPSEKSIEGVFLSDHNPIIVYLSF